MLNRNCIKIRTIAAAYACHERRRLMRILKKFSVLLLALMLASISLLAGCGGSKTDYSALQNDVVKGGNVFVDESGVVFFGYDKLLCSALFDEGNINDFVVEASFTGDVYSLAIFDNALYVSASDGIFKYDLELFNGSGTASPEVLWKKNLSRFNSFQIYDGKMFFIYGVTLCYLPLEGGTETSIAQEVVDFEVTSDGILYVCKDGELHKLSNDFSEDNVVGTMAASDISLGSDGAYYMDSGALKCISPDSGEVSEIKTDAALGDFTYPWINGDTIMYSDADYKYHQITDGSDKEIGDIMDYPQKYMGYAFKDWVVSQNMYYTRLDVISMKGGAHTSYDLKSELAADLEKASGKSGQSSSGGGTSNSGSYDLTKGMQTVTSPDGSIEYIYFNDFMITMPNNEKWSMETAPRAVTFYLFSAQQEGYGGKLVSIAAYDLDDDTYKQLPSYHEAGITANTNVRLVAIYPTDVQWNHNDAAQEADYRELEDYLQKIGAGAVNSPLQTGDSD